MNWFFQTDRLLYLVCHCRTQNVCLKPSLLCRWKSTSRVRLHEWNENRSRIFFWLCCKKPHTL